MNIKIIDCPHSYAQLNSFKVTHLHFESSYPHVSSKLVQIPSSLADLKQFNNLGGICIMLSLMNDTLHVQH